jgi:hypothetical protein
VNTAAGGGTVDLVMGERGVIESVFGLLEFVHTLEPVRLVELTAETGKPIGTASRSATALPILRPSCDQYPPWRRGALLLNGDG